MTRFFVFLLALLAGLVPASAQVDNPTTVFALSVSLKDGDRLIGTPKVTLVADQPAIITVEKEGGYALKMTLSTIAGSNVVNVRSEIRFVRNGKWIDVAAPAIRTTLEDQASYQSVPLAFNENRPVYMSLLVQRMNATAAQLKNLSENACQKKQLAMWSDMNGTTIRNLFTQVQSGGCCRTKCFVCCGSPACCSDAQNCGESCCTAQP